MDGSLSTDALQHNNDGYQQTINNIKDLQNLEKDLYTKLEMYSTDAGNDPEQNDLVNRINKVSQIRISLLQNLNTMSDTLQTQVGNSRVNLVDQLTIIGFVEKELNQIKAQLNQSDNIKHNKLRMVEINTYYSKRYRAYTELMKIVIFSSFFFVVLALLKKKGIVPENIVNGVLTVFLIISLYFFVKKVNDIFWRNNMNFDEYDWFLIPDTSGKTVYEYDKEAIEDINVASALEDEAQYMAKEASGIIGCVAADCCGTTMTYDKTNKKCVDKNPPSQTAALQTASLQTAAPQNPVDSFLTMAFIKSNDTARLNSPSSDIKPYSSSNNYATI
jgi:hypothetical protein